MKMLSKLKRNTDGATMIEFAVSASIMFTLLLAFFEFCRALFTQGVLHYAAEQATRYAMVNFEQDNLDQAYLDSVRDEIKSIATDSFILIHEDKVQNFVVDVIADPSDNTKTVNVKIDYKFVPIMPFLPIPELTLSGSSASFLIQ